MGNDGFVKGNIIIDQNGGQHPLDNHDPGTFQKRVLNYIVGDQSAALITPEEVQIGRERSLQKLSQMFGRQGNRAFDIIGRYRKMDADRVNGLMDWLRGIKAEVN